MPIDPDLREFITLSLNNVVKELTRLSVSIEMQATQVRNIELQTTTRIAELQKDVNNAMEEIEVLRKHNDSKQYSLEKEEGVRQAADMSIVGKIEKMEETQKKKWDDQVEVNHGFRILTRLLWTILGIMLPMVIAFVWSLIVNGGVKGLP